MTILKVKKYYLPFDQKRVIEKSRFTNTPLKKALEKQAQLKEKNK